MTILNAELEPLDDPDYVYRITVALPPGLLNEIDERDLRCGIMSSVIVDRESLGLPSGKIEIYLFENGGMEDG